MHLVAIRESAAPPDGPPPRRATGKADFGICAPCGLPAPQGQLSRRKNQSSSFPSAGSRPLRRAFKKSTVKATRGRNSALRFGPHPSHAECGTADHRKAEKTFTRDRSTNRGSFGSLGNTQPGTGEGPTIAAGRLALTELQLGMAYCRELPRGGLSSRNRSSGSSRY